MKTLSRHIICYVVLLLGCASVHAQEKEDFDASKYSMQKRHIQRSERFTSATSFFDNTYVSLYVGSTQMFADEFSTYSTGPGSGVAFGKWFTDVNGVRLDVFGSNSYRNFDGKEVWAVGADASYVHNVLYSPKFISIGLLAGLGYRDRIISGEDNSYLSAHIGMNIGMRIFENLDFFFEPRAGLLTDFNRHKEKEKATRYNYGFNFGLSYNFIPEGIETYKPSYKSGMFISLMGGGQFQLSKLVFNSTGIISSIGPQASLSFGKWYSDLFALRLSAFYSNDIYARYMDEFTYRTQYYGARLEAMFELLHFIPDHNAEQISFSVMFGPEVGGIHKTDLNELLKSAYLGLGGGFNLNFKVTGPFSVFIEPRFSMVPYEFKPSHNIETSSALVNYIDVVTSLNVGVCFDW